MKTKKTIISAVSIILVVGVVIGTVVVVHNKNKDPQVNQRQNALKTICLNTDDQKLCHDTLSNVKNSSDPKAFLGAAIQASLNNVIKALNMTDTISIQQGNNTQSIVKMATNDCKDFIQSAMDSLKASSEFLGNTTLQTLTDQSPDFKNWLASVISYQQACMDGFDDNQDAAKKVKAQIGENGLDDMGKLTGIALDMMADFENILSHFGLKVQLNNVARRLIEVDNEGYPTWFKASERKLLADMKRRRGHHIKPNVVVSQENL